MDMLSGGMGGEGDFSCLPEFRNSTGSNNSNRS
jgi:hypothetical protein